MSPEQYPGKFIAIALIVSIISLCPAGFKQAGAASPAVPPEPCNCKHLIDLKDMINQIDQYILGYQEAANFFQDMGKLHPSFNDYRNILKVKVDERVREKYAKPARYAPAYGFGGGTDVNTCEVTNNPNMDACLTHLNNLHEQVHSAVCKKRRPYQNELWFTVLDKVDCVDKALHFIGCGYQSNGKLSDAFLEEVVAYNLQKEEALKQLAIAKQDLTSSQDRQLTCEENMLKPQDPDYKNYLKSVVGDFFSWLGK